MTNDLSAEEVRALLKLAQSGSGVEKVDVEIGDVEALAAKYPDVADDLRSFQQG